MGVMVVVGAQYGSEGKGVIVSDMAWQGTDHLGDKFTAFVRVGGPNAGHSHIAYGRRWAQRMLPVGWARGGNSAQLILGRGAVVNPKILNDEIYNAAQYDSSVFTRVIVDDSATLLRDEHTSREGHTQGELHRRIGSTGEGVGAARMERMERDGIKRTLVRDAAAGNLFSLGDTVSILNAHRKDGEVLIEGTQGSGLSLIHGPWPYVTTADTNASGILADCGFSPGYRDVRTILVARTYPIRVAGKSGPIYNEISWAELSSRIGKATLERTTVTKLVRRIGEWDDELFKRACLLNNPAWIALTFMDYIDPDLEGETDFSRILRSSKAAEFIRHVEEVAGVLVKAVGTGGDNWSVAWRY